MLKQCANHQRTTVHIITANAPEEIDYTSMALTKLWYR
jgi:hypothetical protein